MSDLSELGTELVSIMKDGLRAQGWLDPIQVTELKKEQNSEIMDEDAKIENLETKVRDLKTLMKEVHDQLFDAYHKGSLSARGCATIAAQIKDELEL